MIHRMRTGLNITGVLFIFSLLWGACSKVEQGENYWNSQTGKQSFGVVENNIGACMSFFDLALRLNAYLELTEDQKNELQDLYFADYQLEQDEEGSWLGIKGADTVFTVKPDPSALTTESAVWELDGCCEAYQGVLRITCTEIRCWTLEVISVINGDWTTEACLKVKYQGAAIPTYFNEGDWNISGSGNSISMEAGDSEGVVVNFNVITPLVKIADSKYLFNEGAVFMALKDIEQQREEMIKAELKLLPDKGRKLQICCMGNVYSYTDDPVSF